MQTLWIPRRWLRRWRRLELRGTSRKSSGEVCRTAYRWVHLLTESVTEEHMARYMKGQEVQGIKMEAVQEGSSTAARDFAIYLPLNLPSGQKIIQEYMWSGQERTCLLQVFEPVRVDFSSAYMILETRRTEILEWLSQTKYQAHHRVVSEQRLEGTGHWLLAKDEFVQWRASAESCLLWLHGIRKRMSPNLRW